MDPAVVDRRTTHFPGVDEAGLPVRAMSIAGLEGRLAARILSRTCRGRPSDSSRSRVTWGSGVAGGFSADVRSSC